MAGRSSGRRLLGTDPEDAKELLKRAAERCVDRHGIHKTTMEDIAREAGVSRPSVYRYFEDRDELILAVMAERSGALIDRAHRFMRRQATFDDVIVEGLIYIADHGRRDPFTRRLVASEDSQESQRLLRSNNAAARFASEFWDPILDDAQAEGVLPLDLTREEIHFWLAQVGLMLMTILDGKTESTDRARRLLQAFVVPAFRSGPVAGANGRRKGSAQRA
jgi:AcrR family transcriptional regulator